MKGLRLLIITGLSGSGKSTAIDALEDIGYFCVDNMPVLLVPKFLELRSTSDSGVHKIALGMDIREREFVERYEDTFYRLQEQGYRPEILFLEASEEALIKRFSQTRRHHPIGWGKGLTESIREEEELLRPLKEISDRIIETSTLTVHQLKELIIRHAERSPKTERMRLDVFSFGFKHGLPLNADLVMDARFIPNPYFVPELKHLDGKDDRVRNFVCKWPETRRFLEKYRALLDDLMPYYEKEGKSYLTIAVGCTGGRHRSVVVAEVLFDHFKNRGRDVAITHRDLEVAE